MILNVVAVMNDGKTKSWVTVGLSAAPEGRAEEDSQGSARHIQAGRL